MLFEKEYTVRGLSLRRLPPEGVIISLGGPHELSVRVRPPTAEEVGKGFKRDTVFCGARSRQEPNPRVKQILEDLIALRPPAGHHIPSGWQGDRYYAEGGREVLRERHPLPLSYLPDAAQSFIKHRSRPRPSTANTRESTVLCAGMTRLSAPFRRRSPAGLPDPVRRFSPSRITLDPEFLPDLVAELPKLLWVMGESRLRPTGIPPRPLHEPESEGEEPDHTAPRTDDALADGKDVYRRKRVDRIGGLERVI